jgi:hypothetical protein
VSLGAGGVGWIAHAASSAPSAFVPIAPCRLFDTRPAPDNVGDRSTPLAAGEELTRQVTGTNGNCTIPANATSIAYNLTIPTSLNGYLTVFPADAPRPTSSSINPVAGESVKANGGVVGLSSTGAIKLYSLTGPVDAILDITGYYTTAGTVQGAIASGQTVRGEMLFDTVMTPNTPTELINLPGVAPVALTSANVAFGATSGAQDADPTCTGTLAQPTAPPGKVCIYLGATDGIDIDSTSGRASTLASQAFQILIPGSGNVGDRMYMDVTWAYTAP